MQDLTARGGCRGEGQLLGHMLRRAGERRIHLVIVRPTVHCIAICAHQEDEQAGEPAVPDRQPEPQRHPRPWLAAYGSRKA